VLLEGEMLYSEEHWAQEICRSIFYNGRLKIAHEKMFRKNSPDDCLWTQIHNTSLIFLGSHSSAHSLKEVLLLYKIDGP